MEDDLDIFAPQDEGRENFKDDLYKKWFRTKDRNGFIAVREWLDAGKISVDIGEVREGGLKNHTMAWANAVELVVYLKAVVDGNASELYPAPKGGGSPETFTYYGGATIDGKPVSRILKVEHWSTMKGDQKVFDASGFAWKCGHFAARKQDSGAFIPDMSKPLSQNKIKVSKKEMAEIFYRLDLTIRSYVAKEDDPMRGLNGNKR